jgi:hypothetical protein
MAVWTGQSSDCLWTFFTGDISAADWKQSIDHFKQRINGPDLLPGAGLTVSFKAAPPSSIQRQQLSAFLAANEAVLRDIRGTAFITESALARGAFTALNWLYQKPFREKVFGDLWRALLWLQEIDSKVHPAQVVADMQQKIPEDLLQGVLKHKDVGIAFEKTVG